jgi:RimJ/RimL family protein N-acetyltransferase
VDVLYEILSERAGDSKVNISHDPKSVTYESHKAFVENHPYQAWYILENEHGEPVGSLYLTKPPRPSVSGSEFGIFIRKKFRGQGYGKRAIQTAMTHHGPGRYLANINPSNGRSIGMFEALGFRHCQNTYELVRE